MRGELSREITNTDLYRILTFQAKTLIGCPCCCFYWAWESLCRVGYVMPHATMSSVMRIKPCALTKSLAPKYPIRTTAASSWFAIVSILRSRYAQPTCGGITLHKSATGHRKPYAITTPSIVHQMHPLHRVHPLHPLRPLHRVHQVYQVHPVPRAHPLHPTTIGPPPPAGIHRQHHLALITTSAPSTQMVQCIVIHTIVRLISTVRMAGPC